MKIVILAIKDNKPVGSMLANSIDEAVKRAETALLLDFAKEIRGFTGVTSGKYPLSKSRWLIVEDDARPAPAGTNEKE